jgi:hypothetical protein
MRIVKSAVLATAGAVWVVIALLLGSCSVNHAEGTVHLANAYGTGEILGNPYFFGYCTDGLADKRPDNLAYRGQYCDDFAHESLKGARLASSGAALLYYRERACTKYRTDLLCNHYATLLSQYTKTVVTSAPTALVNGTERAAKDLCSSSFQIQFGDNGGSDKTDTICANWILPALAALGRRDAAADTASALCQSTGGFSCTVAARMGRTYDTAAAEQRRREQSAANHEASREFHERTEEEIARRDRERAEKEQSQAAMIGALQSIATSTPAPVIVVPRPVPPASVRSSAAPVYGVPNGTTIGASGRPLTPGPAPGGPPPVTYGMPNGTTIGASGRPPTPGPAPGGNQTPGGGGPQSNAGNACANMNAVVTFTSSRPTGLGHCSGEITGQLTNHGSQRLWCVHAFYSNGIKTKDGGGGSIAPGQTTGGEGSGLWSCGADTIKYACFVDTPAAYACTVNF